MPLPNAASLPPVDLAAWAQFDASPGYESARRRPASRIRSERTAGAVPDRPTWLHRIPEILEWLRTEEAPPMLHRALIEKRFQLRRRQAIRVLHEAGASRAGRDSLVRKEDLALYLEARNGVEAAAAARQRALLAQRIEGARGTREARLLEARPAPPRSPRRRVLPACLPESGARGTRSRSAFKIRKISWRNSPRSRSLRANRQDGFAICFQPLPLRPERRPAIHEFAPRPLLGGFSPAI
jgi:hypothetical protein